MMRIYFKVGMVLLASVLVTLIVSIWTFSAQLSDFKATTKKESLDKKVALLSNSLELQSQYSIQRLLQLTTREWEKRVSQDDLAGLSEPKSYDVQSSEFLGVLHFTKPKLEKWKLLWGSVTPAFLTATSQDYWENFSDQFSWNRVRNDNVTWLRILGPKNEPFIALIVKASMQNSSVLSADIEEPSLSLVESILIGLLPITHFERLGLGSKGSELRVMVVNEEGFALLHPTTNYIGSNLKSLKVVEHALKNAAPGGKFEYESSEGLNFSVFRKMVASNLKLVVEDIAPRSADVVSATLVTKSLIYTLAVWVAFLGLLILVMHRMGRGFSDLQEAVLRFIKGRPVALEFGVTGSVQPLVKGLEEKQDYVTKIERQSLEARDLLETTPECKTTDIENGDSLKNSGMSMGDLRSTYEKISMGLSQSLRAPLASILGHTQMASRQSGAEASKHMSIVQEEARKAREIVDGLTQFCSLDVKESAQQVNVHTAVLKARESVAARLRNEDILWDLEVARDIFIFIQPRIFHEILVELFNNAIDSAESSVERVIRVKAAVTEVGTTFSVENSGRLEAEIEKLTHPFYTTHPSEEHPGLGLTVVQSSVRAFKGTMTFGKSVLGGLTVRLDWPAVNKGAGVTVPISNEIEGPIPSGVMVRPDEGTENQNKQDLLVEDVEEWTVSDSNGNNNDDSSKSRKVREKDGVFIHEAKSSLDTSKPGIPIPDQSEKDLPEMTVELSSMSDDELEKTVPITARQKIQLDRRAPDSVGPDSPLPQTGDTDGDLTSPLYNRRASDKVGPGTPEKDPAPSLANDELELTQPMRRKSDHPSAGATNLDMTQSIVTVPAQGGEDEEMELTQNLGAVEPETPSEPKGIEITQDLGSLPEMTSNLTKPLSKDQEIPDGITEPLASRKVPDDSPKAANLNQAKGTVTESQPPGLPVERPKAKGDHDNEGVAFPPTPTEDLLSDRALSEDQETNPIFPKEQPMAEERIENEEDQDDEIQVKIRPPKLKD